MTREHECECNVDGCRCSARIACTPGADWCDDCDEGRHADMEPYPGEPTDTYPDPDGHDDTGYPPGVELRPNGTPNGFFLTLRQGPLGDAYAVVWCLVHELPITSSSRPGWSFGTEDEARDFIRTTWDWYRRDDGPTRCYFRHPEGGRELTLEERGLA